MSIGKEEEPNKAKLRRSVKTLGSHTKYKSTMCKNVLKKGAAPMKDDSNFSSMIVK